MLKQLRIEAALCAVHATSAEQAGNHREMAAWKNAELKIRAAIRSIRIAPSYRRQDENGRAKQSLNAPTLSE